MANLIVRRGGPEGEAKKLAGPEEQTVVDLGRGYCCAVRGVKGTYSVLQDGDNTVVAVGYLCLLEEESRQRTLERILRDFSEGRILDYKKKLVGEYVLLVKKGTAIHILTDFVGTRNVFYSDAERCLSTTYAGIEDALGCSAADLEPRKLQEYIAMRHVLYPTWLGRSTYHRKISWLLPYEYIAIDTDADNFRIGSVVYEIDNRKERNLPRLADELVSTLSRIMARGEFRNSNVGSSLTGGHDSRLVSAVARTEFPNVRFRTSVSQENPRSQRDLRVAKKVTEVAHVPHDVYPFVAGKDEERFIDLTEGLSPRYNQTITRLLESAGRYSLGFGGAFGTELFMPITHRRTSDYVEDKVRVAQRFLKVEESFWPAFRNSIEEQFRQVRAHHKLTVADEQDDIRLFGLLVTGRYSSFLISGFNRTGIQIDPYGSFSTLEIALRVSPSLWGDHRKLGGNGLVQKAAMSRLNPQMGRVLSYMHFRPMLTLSARTFPRYLMGYLSQSAHVLKNRLAWRVKGFQRVEVPGGYYLTDGWESYLLERTKKRYGLSARPG